MMCWCDGAAVRPVNPLVTVTDSLLLPNPHFDIAYAEPLGRYCLDLYLRTQHPCDDRLLFLSEIEFYEQISELGLRQRLAPLIFDKYLNAAESVSDLRIGPTNLIGVYGTTLNAVTQSVTAGEAPVDLFDQIRQQILVDLKFDVYPRFRTSPQFQTYRRGLGVAAAPIRLDDFDILALIGEGAFGTVYACRRKSTGQMLAAKCLSKRSVYGRDAVDRVMSERDALISVRSPFVSALKYALQDDRTLIFMLELIRGGDLRTHLLEQGRFSPEHARFYAAEILLGLQAIHAQHIIFRDLKLDNVLLDESGHCKISDFGMAVRTEAAGATVTGYYGTPGYTAPEVVLSRPYNYICDYFSYGVVLYMILSGRAPFAGFGDDSDRIAVRCEPDFDDDAFNANSISLLTCLLQKDPERRLADPDQIKQHPFFANTDWALVQYGLVPAPACPRPISIDLPHTRSRLCRRWRRPTGVEHGSYRRLQLSEKFCQALASFDYVAADGVQDEIVQSLRRYYNS